MRIAMLNAIARQAGGAETYLARVTAALSARGHAVALAAEHEGPETAAPIVAERLAPTGAAVAAWGPDVIINHGLEQPALEAATLAVAPAVMVAHDYAATCISGSKTFSFPRIAPCEHRLGFGCLLRYYPRRTGGLNPLTLAERWTTARARQRLLPRYRRVLTFSDHMRREYAREVGDRAVVVPFPVPPVEPAARTTDGPRTRVLFVGRLEPLKGVHVLLEAMAALPGLTLTVVGDGAERASLERAAMALGDRVRFTGWLADVTPAYRDADLLVVPSLWPEPFGQVGLEAARFALPATAFAVGGIPEWLRDGENGTLARRAADPAALAEAIRRALDPTRYDQLARGARARLTRHSLDRHVTALEAVL